MKPKQIVPLKKCWSGRASGPYVKFNQKMLYINDDASVMLGVPDYVRMSLSLSDRALIITRAEKAEDSFRLSHVNETRHARRIETNRALLSVIKAGFPLYMIDKRLPVKQLLDGSIAADFSMLVPIAGVKNGKKDLPVHEVHMPV